MALEVGDVDAMAIAEQGNDDYLKLTLNKIQPKNGAKTDINTGMTLIPGTVYTVDYTLENTHSPKLLFGKPITFVKIVDLKITINGADKTEIGDLKSTGTKSRNGSYTFTAAEGNHTLTFKAEGRRMVAFWIEQKSEVNFSYTGVTPVVSHNVNFNVVGEHGELTAAVDGAAIAKNTKVVANKTVVFTATPNTGYVVKEWKLGTAIQAGTTTTFTLNNLTAAANVTVEFEKMPTVTFNVVNGHGSLAATADSVAIATGDSVLKTKTVVFTATPDSKFRVKAWKLNNVVQAEKTNTFTLNSLAASATVTVEFEAITNASIMITGDDSYELYLNGTLISTPEAAPNRNTWSLFDTIRVNLEDEYVLAAKVVESQGNIGGFNAKIIFDDGSTVVAQNNSNWRLSTTPEDNWKTMAVTPNTWVKVTDVKELANDSGWNGVAGNWVWTAKFKVGTGCDKTVYFRYTGSAPEPEKTYTVSFEPNNAALTVGAITGVKKNATVTLPGFPNTPLEDPQFMGWYTDNNTFANKFTNATPVTEDVTLYAKWCSAVPAITYTVTYVALDATEGAVPTDPGKYKAGAPVFVEGAGALKKDGHTFAGWKANAPQANPPKQTLGVPLIPPVVNSETTYQEDDVFVMGNYDVVLTAQWTKTETPPGPGPGPTTYTVTFDTNSTLEAAPKTGLEKGATISLPELSRDGYTLEGWYENEGDGVFTNSFTSETAVTKDITIHAKWVENYFISVYYDANGADAASLIDLPIDSTHYQYGFLATVKSPGALSKTGFEFAGWKASRIMMEATGLESPMVQLDKIYAAGESFAMNEYDILLTAQWTEKAIVVDPVTPVDPTTPTRHRNNNNNNNTVETVAIVPETTPLGVPAVAAEVVPTIAPVVQVAEEVVPLGLPVLPKTGEIPASLFYGVGGLLTALGVFIKRK